MIFFLVRLFVSFVILLTHVVVGKAHPSATVSAKASATTEQFSKRLIIQPYPDQSMLIPTPTPQIVPPKPSQKPELSAGNMYTIEPGDTIAELARVFGLTMEDIIVVNQIEDADLIYPGQMLRIQKWVPQTTSCEGKEIRVSIALQRAYAFEHCELIREFVVSTGLVRATPTGTFWIGRKLLTDDMSGPGYNIPGVPHVMYFDGEGDSFHGAPWHNNFGNPMSHGCVNMKVGDAQWLYEWTPLGTRVVIE
jgi:LysM repeat protein